MMVVMITAAVVGWLVAMRAKLMECEMGGEMDGESVVGQVMNLVDWMAELKVSKMVDYWVNMMVDKLVG